MATTYNCEIRNILGSNNRDDDGASVYYLKNRGVIANVTNSSTGIGFSHILITTSEVDSYLTNLGYSNISGVSFSFNQENQSFLIGFSDEPFATSNYWRVKNTLEDGTELFGSLTGINTPITDYSLTEITDITISFDGTIGSAQVPTPQSHVINITANPFPSLRTLTDLRNFFVSLGFSANGAPSLPTTQPSIYCEQVNDDGMVSTSSTVLISSDFTTTTVVNTVVESTGVSQTDFDALKADLQTQIDNQVVFVNTVSDALNRNVSGALQSSTETRELLVALQLGTIPNIESRLSALENE